MSLIYAYKSRGLTKDLTILDGAGAAVEPGDNDELRISIGREGATPLLTFTSDAATANGSSITKSGGVDGSHRMRLDAADLNFAAGCYTLIFDYLDNADAEEWKNISRQVFVLEDT
jgi:hypothetical protein